MKNLLLTYAIALIGALLTACSSQPIVDRDMFVSVDDRYVDATDRVELMYRLNTEPRWTNLNDKHETATHVLSAKTVCRVDESIWKPFKFVKDCKAYLVMTEAKTSRVLFQSTENISADFKDVLDWSDAIDDLYDEFELYKENQKPKGKQS